MNLTVRFERRSHDSPNAPTHTFVSLPTAIASSLWSIKPHASLTVLRIRVSGSDDIFVAWAGDTVKELGILAVHPLFAAALGLSDGQAVDVLVCRRVVANGPEVGVASATLRPVSYADAEPGDASATAAQRRSTARDHYRLLSETADILEQSLLPQIRVLYHGLRFPLSLPAKTSITVEVTHLKLLSDSDDEFGVLMPGTELVVEPPPQEPESSDDTVRIHGRFRALSFSEALQAVPHSLLLSHALLPQKFAAGGQVRSARVSRSPLQDGDFVLPIVFVCRDEIPLQHVWLPPFIWHDLRLVSLDPIFIEEVSMFPQAPHVVQIASHDHGIADLPSFREICQARGIIYDGMRLRNGKLIMSDSRIAKAESKSPGEENAVSQVMGDWEGTDRWRNRLDISFGRSRSKVRTVSAWKISESHGITVKDYIEDSNASAFRHFNDDLITANPFADDRLRVRLAETLTRSSRSVVHEALRWTRRTLSTTDGLAEMRASRILMISGPEGSGKSTVCKTIAAILRNVGRLRTTWIQCTRQRKKSSELVKGIQRAYDSASDGGPGIVVLDDLDYWIGARRSENEDDSEDKTNEAGKNGHATEVLRRMEMRRSYPVLSIITCQSTKDLDVSFRAPGVISTRLTLELPERGDISVLRWAALQDLRLTNRELEFGSDFARIANSMEGYNAKEVRLLLSRAVSQVEGRAAHPEGHLVVEQLEKMISEMAAGSMKTRSRLRNKEASWEWNRIGGADNAKRELVEVLLWPSKHHELFECAPLSLPRGVLLYGPPGCGKTLLAKAAAHESKMRCILVKGPELMSKYIGESEAQVRRAFAQASRLRPSVLLFDEFDALAPRRGSGTGVTDRIVNTLLTCMDGAERLSDGVYLIATSSRPELIDPAVLRPGRIDRWVPVEMPASAEERYDILKCLSEESFRSSKPLLDALQSVAHVTEDYSGADLGAILNDARIKLRRKRRKKKPCEDEIIEAIGEALRQSHPSMSDAEMMRFRQVMDSFKRRPEMGGKRIPKSQKVALR